MRTIILLSAFLSFPAASIAQDTRDEEAELDIEPDPVARAIWAPTGDAPAVEQDAAGAESDAFARIHDDDARLPELERARRMVGFDVMDGVR
ncbi:MAG: hypothetical protein HYY06_31455 [Deltaproteobacteria bacterium]|nr:hypothetical protein [Deltaproteobacteria bacterium]